MFSVSQKSCELIKYIFYTVLAELQQCTYVCMLSDYLQRLTVLSLMLTLDTEFSYCAAAPSSYFHKKNNTQISVKNRLRLVLLAAYSLKTTIGI